MQNINLMSFHCLCQSRKILVIALKYKDQCSQTYTVYKDEEPSGRQHSGNIFLGMYFIVTKNYSSGSSRQDGWETDLFRNDDFLKHIHHIFPSKMLLSGL